MKITTKLVIEYFKRNKKRNMVSIIAISLVTILITLLLVLFSSYQEYMVNSTRSISNWEAKFCNITYAEAKEIEKYKNIKEISVSNTIGVSEENFREDQWGSTLKFFVKGYDQNALKNAKINLYEGRLPENSNEIVLNISSIENFHINDVIEMTINGNLYKYTIVGKTETLDFGSKKFIYTEEGAITLLETEKLEDNSIVDVSILTNNIKEICKTTTQLANLFGITDVQKSEKKWKANILDTFFKNLKSSDTTSTNNINVVENEEISPEIIEKFKNYLTPSDPNIKRNASLIYNTEILNYAGVLEIDTEFAKSLFTMKVYIILLISFFSVVMLYTSFKITFSERIKEFRYIIFYWYG